MVSSDRKIYLFGDSYTQGHNVDDGFSWYVEWYKLLGNKFPPNWYELLSKKLNCAYVNFGQGGNSNYEIFERFCKNAHLINKNDIVFFQWAYMHRFRWARKIISKDGVEKNEWYKYSAITAHSDWDYNENLISKKTLEEISYNRTNDLYHKELLNFENLIEQYSISKGFEVYFWYIDEDCVYNSPREIVDNKKYICKDRIIENLDYYVKMRHKSALLNMIITMGGKLIVDETNGVIRDGTHLGARGHELQFELFYEHLSKYSKLL